MWYRIYILVGTHMCVCVVSERKIVVFTTSPKNNRIDRDDENPKITFYFWHKDFFLFPVLSNRATNTKGNQILPILLCFLSLLHCPIHLWSIGQYECWLSLCTSTIVVVSLLFVILLLTEWTRISGLLYQNLNLFRGIYSGSEIECRFWTNWISWWRLQRCQKRKF